MIGIPIMMKNKIRIFTDNGWLMEWKIYEMMDVMWGDDAACWMMISIYIKTMMFNIQLKLSIKYLVKSVLNLICKKYFA